MGPIASNHCGPFGEPHPGGREPHQSHGNVSQMTTRIALPQGINLWIGSTVGEATIQASTHGEG